MLIAALRPLALGVSLAFGAYLTLLAQPAAAGEVAPDAGALAIEACSVEIFRHGQAACIGRFVADRLLAMEVELAGLTAELQGARAETLLEFEDGLRDAQQSWRIAMEMFCKMTGAVRTPEHQLCRLERTLEREVELAGILDRAFAALGGVPGAQTLQGEVEVFVPLPAPAGGPEGAAPGAFIDVPIWFR